MKLGDIVNGIVIDPRKLTDYALNRDNPVGADKAVIFQRDARFYQEASRMPSLYSFLGISDEMNDRAMTKAS